jgi:serine/threonine-protein kinase
VQESDDTAHEVGAGPLSGDSGPAKGSEVGGYVIDGELGRGGMGVVYSATHPVIGKRVAIKVLKPSLSENPASVERFVQEARSVNAIGHPNIVDIFGLGRLPDGRSYLVMDLLEGESLRVRLRRGPLHVREATQVIDDMADALTAAHTKGFIHRDLKPDNVFLVAQPGRVDVKLLDFGLAKLMPTAGSRVYRTATGAQLGTPDYMSPEQVRGASEVDARADIYSLGIVAIEILTGKRPRKFSDGTFDGGTTRDLLATVQAPEELVQLISAMVAPEPDDRPTLAAVRTLLKRVRPSLVSMSVVGLPVELPATQTDPTLAALTATKVGARPVVPTPAGGAPVAQPAPVAPALRMSGTHPSTTVGVPPPPARQSRPHPSAAPPVERSGRESRTWLAIALVVLVACAIALVVVLSS